ncbi:MAG: TRCF domain-containing protein [Ignavibacteria bacterium]
MQAFAYLIAPPDAKLTKIAVKRLQAIEEFTDLGSGFLLAMRDMEIRGVGNLLGRQQSGFIQEIGFDLFISTIEEAVLELKENEFKDLFTNEKSLQKINESIKKKIEERSTVIENDLNALIPKDYIQNDTERLNIYRRLYELKNEEELDLISKELKDRFGEYLDDVSNLLRMIGIKLTASGLGFEKLTIRNRTLTLYFPEDKENKLYHGEFFDNIIQKLSNDRSGRYTLLPEKDRLVIEIRLESDDDEKRLRETEEVVKRLQ